VKILIRIIAFLVFVTVYSAKAQEILRSPINYKMRLSGSFGELRTNHFHTGIDIKSSGNWKTNKAISIMDGFIYRIRIAPGGYGNALYIKHPNGLTSVYAHLYSFNDRITKLARHIQYTNQSFSINPDSLHIPVKKGEIIGQIGNTGRSFGTHLHFELRNSKNEHPVNPFKYGIKPKDIRPPVFQMLKIVALDTSLNVLNSKKYNLKKTKSGIYTTLPTEIKYGAWRVGVEILGFDRMNGGKNKNGIYNLEMFVDSKKVYSFKLDSLDFEKQRNLNAHIDYHEFLINKSKYNRLYILPGNDLDIYNTRTKNSVFPLFENKVRIVEIIAKDFDGNKTKLKFRIKRDPNILAPEPKSFNHVLVKGEDYDIQYGDYRLKVNKKDLYKNMYLFLSNSVDTTDEKYSDNIKVFTNYEVFKNNVNLYIRPTKIDSLFDKMFLAKIDKKKIINLGNKYKDGYFKAKIKNSGTFKLMVDTIAPSIKEIKFKKRSTRNKKIAFIIKENYAVGGYAKPISFDGYIDGEWVLFEYDEKKNKIIHRFDNKLSKGGHHFKLIVKDDRDNFNIFEKEIWFK